MKQRLSRSLWLLTGFVVLSACAQTNLSSDGLSPDLGMATAQVQTPVTDSTSQATNGIEQQVREFFAPAQRVLPFQPWKTDPSFVANANGGYTLIFEDLYGVPYAYATHISRATKSINPRELALRHQPSTFKSEERDWLDMTYVTGANTRRSPISAYFQGFPLLDGLFSPTSLAKGFSPENVEKLVMPNGWEYWARTKDGRYFDLGLKEWLKPEIVEKARQMYTEAVLHARATPDFISRATAYWQQVEETYPVHPSQCTGSQCVVPEGQLNLSWVTRSPRSCRWFGAAFVCDESAQGELSTTVAFKYRDDNDQGDFRGAATGCGPTAMTNLLWWWQKYGGAGTLLRPNGSDPDGNYQNSKTNTQIELITDTGAWVCDGTARCANGWDLTIGLNKYLERYKLNYYANDVMGWGSSQMAVFYQAIAERFELDQPVVVGHFVAARSGHFGMLQNFRKDLFGSLFGAVVRPPDPMYANMNLGEFFSTSSIHWLRSYTR